MSSSRYFDQSQSSGSSYSRGDCGFTQAFVTPGSVLYNDFDNGTEELRALVTTPPANATSFYMDEDGHFIVDYTGTDYSGPDQITYDLYVDCNLVGTSTASLEVGATAIQPQEVVIPFTVEALTLIQEIDLATDDALLTFSIDTLTLGGGLSDISANNLLSAFTLDSISLTSVDTPEIGINGINIPITIDNLSITTEIALAISKPQFNFTVNNIAMDAFNWTPIENDSDIWTDI